MVFFCKLKDNVYKDETVIMKEREKVENEILTEFSI